MTDDKNLQQASGATSKKVQRASDAIPAGASKPVPTLRDRLKPLELLIIAVVLGLFTGLIVLLATREPVLAVIFFGVAFIVTLVITALFVLGMKPTEAEQYDVTSSDGEYPRRPVLYDREDQAQAADAAKKARRNPHD